MEKRLQQEIKINLAEISDWTNSKLKEIISYLDDLISVKKFSTEFWSVLQWLDLNAEDYQIYRVVDRNQKTTRQQQQQQK